MQRNVNSLSNWLKVSFFLAYFGSAAWQAYFYVFLDEIGLKGYQIGLISAVQQFNTIALLPIWGVLADRFGRKKMLVISLFSSAAMLLWFMITGDFYYYMVLIILVTIFTNPIASLIDSVALDFSELYPQYSYGNIRLWASIGWATSSALLGRLLMHMSLDVIFPIASGALFVNGILFLIFYKPLESTRNLQQLNLKSAGKVFAGNRFLLIFFILLFLYGTASAPSFIMLNLYMKDIGGTSFQIGLAFALQAMFELPFFFYGKRLIQIYGPRKLLTFSIGVAALKYFLYSQLNDPVWVLILTFTQGITFAVFIQALIAIVHNNVPPEWKATAQSMIYVVFFGAGIGVSNLWVNFLRDFISMKEIMIWITLMVLLVLILFFLFFRYHKRKNS